VPTVHSYPDDYDARTVRLAVPAILESAARQIHVLCVSPHGTTPPPYRLPDSDIDLLADFDQDSSLFDLMRITRELEELLGHPVDVVSTGGLKDRDRHILSESVDL
jgi:predicted nucleotidyltransferase